METLILRIIAASATLAALRDDPALRHLRDMVNALIAELHRALPVKPDGTPWNADDVRAAAVAADAPWATVEGRTQDDGGT